MPIQPPTLLRHDTGRSPWRWSITGALVGAIAGVVGWAPAQWLGQVISATSGARVQLMQAQGTLWRGQAQLVLSSGDLGAHGNALPGHVLWTLQPTWSGLQGAIQATCCQDSPWRWKLGWGKGCLELQADNQSAGQSRWPAQMLSGLGTPWNTLQPRGNLSLISQDLRLQWGRGGWQLSGQAGVEAWGMGTALSTLNPIGSYRLVVHGGDQPRAELSTLHGPLQLSGEGRLEQGRWRFQGEARSDEASQGALGNLLNIIGRREGARSVITVG